MILILLMKCQKRITILFSLLLILLFKQILFSDVTIKFPSKIEEYFSNENSSTYVNIILDNYDEVPNKYLHISTQSENVTNMPIIISSTSTPHPSINSSDTFSTQRIGNSFLFLGKELLSSQIYLNITCNFYPCSYHIFLDIEDYPLLYPGQTFSYFNKDYKNNFTTFKINSQVGGDSSFIINKSSTHILTIAISFSSPNIIDTELKLLFKDEEEGITIDTKYSMEKRIIYSFKEEDLIKEKGGDPDIQGYYYLLSINSKDIQYITITLSSKEIFNEDDAPINIAIPNEGGKYSLLKKNLLIRECYRINTTMADYSNSLILASISFYAKPIIYYFNDNKRETITPILNSINIIFEKNETGSYQDLCFALENENDEGIYKIEISETKDIFNKKNIYDPLNTGSIYIKSLPIKQLTYYTHNPSNRDYEQMNFNLKVIKGRVEMFVVRCDTFPDCSYTYEELLEGSKNIGNDIIIKPHIINDMFSYSDYAKEGEIDLSPFNYKQNLMFVYCSEETKADLCQFEISFFTEKDKILLLNNDKFYQYMLTKEIDLYQIIVPKSSSPFSKIQVTLYTFTGDANYETINDKLELNITHDFVGGKEIYEYIPKEIYPINEKDFNLQFQIKAVTNTYYEVEYKIINIEYDDTNLENKIYFDEKYTLISTDITYKDQVKYIEGDENNNKKYFAFQNNRKEEQNPYFVQIFSLNCEISVKRDGKIINESENIYQDIISINDTYYENKYYIYEMDIESFDNYGDEETEHQCIIYISGEPLDKEKTNKNNIYSNKILLTENDPHEIILTNDIKSYRYLFPFLGYSKNNDSFMLIHINFDSKMSIKAKFFFDESDMKKEETLGRSGQILLNNKLIKENCKDIEEICNLIIEINFYNVDKFDNRTWSSPNFQLFISSHYKIPSYLKNGELRLDSVAHSNPRQYFYTDISKYSQGQIVLNTKRGEGVLYVRIYKKGTVDSKRTWGDIEIPVKGTSDLLNYDHFTHSVNFEKDHTRKCAYNGCLLLITYENTFSPSKNYDYLIPFTLSTRLYNEDKTKQSILEIPLKAYAFGAIEKRILTYNYFKVYFPEDSEKIDFEIQCETCILYINKNETLPTPEHHDLEYYSHGKFGVFGYLIKGESIKNKFYTLRIESPIISSRYVTTYSLRVLLPTPSTMTNYNLIPVDSDQNAICDLSLYSNDGICYFIVYLDDDSNNLGNILAHVYTDVDLIDLEINANFIPKEIAERAELNDILDYLPETPEASSFSTVNEFYSDFLLIDINERKNNDYIIFGVSSLHSATVTFLSTFYDYKDKVISNSNIVQLMKINSNSNIKLTLGYNNFYLIYLYSLYGSGEIKWVDEFDEIKTHKFNEHELFSFTYYIRDDYTNISSYNNNLAFYMWQDVRQPELFVIYEMDFNMRERFTYTHGSLFLKYYYLLPLIKDEKNKQINFEDLIYYIELSLPDGIGINEDNELIIEGTIVTMEMINKIKLQKNDEGIIDSNNNVKINYDLSTNSAFIILKKEYCENIWRNLNNTDGENAYLYISIKQKEIKELDKDISGKMFAAFRNNTDYIVLSNQMINSRIDMKENELIYYLYNLELQGSYDKNKIILDISSNLAIDDNNLLYSLIDYKDLKNINKEIIKKNSSNIEIDGKNTKYFGGKYHIEFILKEENAKGIYLCLFRDKTTLKENELKSINVIFKYSSYKPSYELPKYEFDDKIKFKQDKQNITINLNKIKKTENSNIYYPKCQFVVRKIEYDNRISNEELSTITLIQSNHEIIYSYKDDKNDTDKIELIIPYTKIEEEKFYISVIANLYEDNEKFAYYTFDSQSHEDEKEEETEEEKEEEQKEEEQKEEKHEEEKHKEEEYEEEEKHKEEEKQKEEEEKYKEEEENKKEEDDKKEDSKDDSTSMIILIIIMGIIVIVIFVLIYLYIYKRNMNKDTEKLMQISFNEGKGGELYDKERE